MASKQILNPRVDHRRVRRLKAGHAGAGHVVYWMSRDQRVLDNWALLHGQDMALHAGVQLIVVFSHVIDFPFASRRHHLFMLESLAEVDQSLARHGIGFEMLDGSPDATIPDYIKHIDANCLITDFSPLKIKDTWLATIISKVKCPVHEVDAHNIVPCWFASPKQEFSARFFRPRIKRWLPEFIIDFPPILPSKFQHTKQAGQSAQQVSEKYNDTVEKAKTRWFVPGEQAARSMLDTFIEEKLADYGESKNDPTRDVLSNLSPYLHFGQISAQRVALEVEKARIAGTGRDVFLEELIVRRELSDNYCYYNKKYDSTDGFPDWARKTLDEHRGDPREYLYSVDDLEQARTHDKLWNAAQREMVTTGKMHGWMRMYWAKKILEWTPTPEKALEVAIYLNDKYELDGRDPNGYVGIAWSIGGLHDRAWGSRPVFGKIRYMSNNGAKSKFNIAAYISANQ